MRLGGPVQGYTTPEQWVQCLHCKGYRAAYAPVDVQAPDTQIEEYRLAALEHDILIAEVGAWGNNPLSADAAVAQAGIAGTIAQLELAEKLRARCCVNVAGSPAAQWDGPHPDNFTPATIERLVAAITHILQAVQPVHTCFTLEPMPHMPPTGPEQIQELIDAVGRPDFAVHLDVVNMLNSVPRYYASGAFTRRCFALLGQQIRVVHVKDCRITGSLPVCIQEIELGQGQYDLGALLDCAAAHPDPDLPLMLEHLGDMAAYDRAAAHLRAVAARQGLQL